MRSSLESCIPYYFILLCKDIFDHTRSLSGDLRAPPPFSTSSSSYILITFFRLPLLRPGIFGWPC